MKLQLFRNGAILASKDLAIQGLRSQLETNGLDGELMVARYSETIDGATTAKTIFGFKAEFTDGTSGVTIYDGDKEAFDKLQTEIVEELTAKINEAMMTLEKKGGVTDTWSFTHGDESVSTLELKYDSSMPDTLTTPNPVGGVASGLTAASLKEKTYGQIIDMILFPELFPKVANPSASIAFKTPFANNQILEVGATAPTADNFTTSLNRGVCSVAGQPNKNRAGALDTAHSFIYYGNNTGTTTLPTKVVLNTMQYNYHAAYGVGDTLVTSYGNTATKNDAGATITNPLAAGSVNSGAIQIFGTYPYYCNGATASSSAQDSNLPSSVTPDTKLPLIKYTDTLVGAKFASEAASGTRNLFEFPSTKKVTKVEMMNPTSGKWDAVANSAWEMLSTPVNKTVQGNSVAYKQWTTVGAMNGERQLRFTLANA